MSCVGAVTVCKTMKLARMMAHIVGNRLELSELVSEHLGCEKSALKNFCLSRGDCCNFLRNSAAPPAPEPAEGRGAAYNNNFFLTLAGGIAFSFFSFRPASLTHLCPWSFQICSV